MNNQDLFEKIKDKKLYLIDAFSQDDPCLEVAEAIHDIMLSLEHINHGERYGIVQEEFFDIMLEIIERAETIVWSTKPKEENFYTKRFEETL